MKFPNLILKIMMGIFLILIPLIGSIYILYISPLIVSIPFVIILGLLMGYFGVIIKMALDKKKRESNIDEKLEKQKFNLKTTDIKKRTVDMSPKEPEVKKPVNVKKKVKKAKKVKKKGKDE